MEYYDTELGRVVDTNADEPGHEMRAFRLDPDCPTCEQAMAGFPFRPPCSHTYWSPCLPIALLRSA